MLGDDICSMKKAIILSVLMCFVFHYMPTVYALDNAEEITTSDVSLVQKKEATCTEPGYVMSEDLETHTIVTETLPATGHRFSDWTMNTDSALEIRSCEVCGVSETRHAVDAKESEVARLNLTGDMHGINKKNRVTLEASFDGQGVDFNCYAIMTLQGHSTMGLDKPNYTVRFYDDSEGNHKHKVCFKNWTEEHKFILKADYYDVTQCRNLIGANLWRDILSTRDNLHPRIASLPSYGAVDGFPISVWLNDEFLGLYTMCLHKDDDLFGMTDGEQAALLICNEHTEDESEFRALAVLDEEGVHNWELEYCATKDDTWVRDSFNSLFEFVSDSSDEEFKLHLSQYLDVDTAIDYLIFIYSLGLENSGTKDLVMVNFGDIWIPSAFDMDEAFGMIPRSFDAHSPSDSFLPVKSEGVWTSNTGSILWDRILQNFESEIMARYSTLKSDVLGEDSILSALDSFTEAIPDLLYLRDAERYSGRPEYDSMIKQIKEYIPERLAVLDIVFGGLQ